MCRHRNHWWKKQCERNSISELWVSVDSEEKQEKGKAARVE
jgi:hypothetical protein